MSEELAIDLSTFFLSISSAAFFSMGMGIEGKESAPPVDLTMARQNIQLLELLSEKTKGNRTQEEDRLLSQLLFEVRMRFVEIQKELVSKK